MADPSRINLGKKWYNEDFAGVPRSEEVLAKWSALLDNQRYLAHVRIIKEFQKHLDPMPNRDHHEELLRRTGHEFAAAQVLSQRTNYFRLLLGSACVGHHDYLAVHGTLAALLLDRRRSMTDGEVAVLYSTMDRLLRGGVDWHDVTHVPTVNKAFYGALRAVRWPVSAEASTLLREIIQPRGEALFGDDCKVILAIMTGASIMLGAAACVRRGAAKVTPSDALEGCLAYLRLFEIDIRDLPLVQRAGQSGYEQA